MAKITFEDFMTEFDVTLNNTETIYRKMEWCADCMIKRNKKQLPVLKEHLLDTSTVSQVITMVKKQMAANGVDTFVSRTDMPKVKQFVADAIWDLYTDRLNMD